MRTIEQALNDCRAAWAGVDKVPFVEGKTWAWNCHHGVEVELLTEPAENRIEYILSKKPTEEQVRRLDNFRPVRSELPKALTEARAALDEAWAAYIEAVKEAGPALSGLHRADVPNHT